MTLAEKPIRYLRSTCKCLSLDTRLQLDSRLLLSRLWEVGFGFEPPVWQTWINCQTPGFGPDSATVGIWEMSQYIRTVCLSPLLHPSIHPSINQLIDQQKKAFKEKKKPCCSPGRFLTGLPPYKSVSIW